LGLVSVINWVKLGLLPHGGAISARDVAAKQKTSKPNAMCELLLTENEIPMRT
jgi:hypothetical protein